MAGEPVGPGGGEGVPRATTQAASPPAPPVPATAYELGVSLAIPTETLDAVLRQAGGSRETSVEDISNIPEMCFMRVLGNARLGGTHEDLGQVTQPSPIPALAIAKLVKWWHRAKFLCPQMCIPRHLTNSRSQQRRRRHHPKG